MGRIEIDRSAFRWPGGQRAAVSLTYDDGLAAHRENVAPGLEAAGLRGTFNVPIMSADFLAYPALWRALAARGHELGNHTLFHPCRRESPGEHAWLHEGYNLVHYTERRYRDEIALANWILRQVDGQSERTFANTCWDAWLGADEGRQPLEPILADYFVAARGARTGRAVNIGQVNLMNLGTTSIDARAFEDIRREIEAVVEAGDWLICTAHGVGRGAHDLYIDAGEHGRLVAWLGAHRDRIWTAPMIAVVRHLKVFGVMGAA